MSSQESPGTSRNTPAPVPAERRAVTVRRAPRYVPFLILGAVAGIIAAAVIAFAVPGDGSYDPGAVFGYFIILCGLGGAALGGMAALLLDRRSVRRARHGIAESVDGPDTDGTSGPGHGSGTGSPARG